MAYQLTVVPGAAALGFLRRITAIGDASTGTLMGLCLLYGSQTSSWKRHFQPSPLDARAALCPDCKHYLVRRRVKLKRKSFFIERCPNCKGLWRDAGEWSVLEALGLNTHIEQIFSGEWQPKVRELELLERERLATIEKLGPTIADRLFELTELLEAHPNNDYGVAYLMRRFEQ